MCTFLGCACILIWIEVISEYLKYVLLLLLLILLLLLVLLLLLLLGFIMVTLKYTVCTRTMG